MIARTTLLAALVLVLPPALQAQGTLNWTPGGTVNIGRPTFEATTVAQLPALGAGHRLIAITDGLSKTDCTVGGETHTVLCIETRAGWSAASGSSGATWGAITGTLSSQSDLASALSEKAASGHTHAGAYEPAFASGLAGQYFRGDKSWQTLDKAAVGLANVDNTSDANKPVSTATQTALDGKAAASHGHAESEVTNLTTDLAGKVPTTRTVNGHALTADVTVTAGDVGLSNVNNTSDADKPVSTATQTALNGKQASLGFTPENAANRAAAGGYASLDSSSLVVQNPANATATPAGSKIPISSAGGTLAAGWLPLPSTSTLGGIKSLTCTGTDKLSAIGTDGLPVCSADASGSDISLARKQPVLFTDCLNMGGVAGFDPFYGTAVASGSINAPLAGLVTTHHPGVVRARSSTTANSGYLIGSNVAAFLLGGGEALEAIFNITTLTNGTFRLGFHDATTSSDAVDGAYLEVASTGVGTGKTASNSTRSTTATTYTLSTATWYRLLIVLDSAATRVDFYLYNDAGTQLWTNNLTTNIPSASGRETGAAVIGTNSGTSATDLYHLDWVAVYFSTARTR
jgi:hypothetical protein